MQTIISPSDEPYRDWAFVILVRSGDYLATLVSACWVGLPMLSAAYLAALEALAKIYPQLVYFRWVSRFEHKFPTWPLFSVTSFIGWRSVATPISYCLSLLFTHSTGRSFSFVVVELLLKMAVWVVFQLVLRRRRT